MALAARPWAESASTPATSERKPRSAGISRASKDVWQLFANTDSAKGKGGVVSSHAKKEPGESLSENEMAKVISDLDFFYSMDFAVNLPILENYEVVESTVSLKTEEEGK